MLTSMKAFMAQACVAACLASAALGATSVASAQDQEAGDIRVDLPARRHPVEPPARERRAYGHPGPLRLYGGYMLDVGGEVKLDDVNGIGGGAAANLDPTIGLDFGADYVIMDYFSIGGETRFLWWKADGGTDRDFLWDLDVKPRGRYAFHNIPLEVYGALPIGLTVAGIKGAGSGGAGFNVGLVGGANYWFTEHIGVNAELGWNFHKFKVSYPGFNSTHWKMNQFECIPTANFVYAL